MNTPEEKYLKRITYLLKKEDKISPSRSMKYPKFMPFFVKIKRIQKKIKNLQLPIAKKINTENYFQYINVRHQSLLMRKLGNTDIQLQKNKIQNIKLAIQHLNGLIIKPGEIFSFRESIGKSTYKKGYLDGMLISKGKVQVGVGGGLCQLSNLLYRMFLHTDVNIKERYRHSFDIFPDSGRTLPFGSGATVFFNYVDLQIKNTLDYPIQLKIRLTENQLKGQILSNFQNTNKIHIKEDFHTFIKYKNKRRRYNTISKNKKTSNKGNETTKKEQVIENLAPVLYTINEKKLQKFNYPFYYL